jgi:hypothetical protein
MEPPEPVNPNRVHDRASFLAFVKALAADYRACAPHKGLGNCEWPVYGGLWENFTVGEFLDAGVSWVESFGSTDTDFPATEASFPAKAGWKEFAVFLFLCKSYYPGRDI